MILNWGGWLIFISYCWSPFYFLSVELLCAFSIFYKILPYYAYYYYILIRIDYAVGTSFFLVPALLLSILTPVFLSASVALSYFILAVPWRKCLGKHSCMSYSFPIAILNGTCFFQTVQLQVHNANLVWYGRSTDALVNLNTKLKCVFL